MVALLLIIASIVPRGSSLSLYELRRRQEVGDGSANEELRRAIMVEDIRSLQRIIEAVLLVLTAVLFMAQWGVWGAVLALVMAAGYRHATLAEAIHTVSQRLYDEYDARLIRFLEKHPRLLNIVSSHTDVGDIHVFASREEFEHMIDRSTGVLTTDEKKLIKSSLHFDGKLVESIMTPRGVIESIDEHEMLGPIVLDQLHKTGHSRFPVIAGDIDHVVGMLHIHDLLALHEKNSQTAKQAMEKHVYYINQNQNLQHALAAFLSTKHHLFIVVNEYRETAGIITLEDCIEALIGKRIIDEFDMHEDLRLVAGRNAKYNNDAPGATTI